MDQAVENPDVHFVLGICFWCVDTGVVNIWRGQPLAWLGTVVVSFYKNVVGASIYFFGDDNCVAAAYISQHIKDTVHSFKNPCEGYACLCDASV
jgi:hypothetical protein